MLKRLFPLVFTASLAACVQSDESAVVTPATVRIATFNIAMGLKQAGEMAEALKSGTDERLANIAEIILRVKPDVLLLNEFDYEPEPNGAVLFNENYLGGAYPHHFRAGVNTGVDSGLDLNGDGKTGGPADAWGFGFFPGQYGMLVLSRYPIDAERSRTFQHFKWNDLPGALRPGIEAEPPVHDDSTWKQLRLSSKSHWDVVINIGESDLHLLAFHPTPPVFDGPEDYNGKRNFDEIRFWREYTDPAGADFVEDDQGRRGGLEPGARFLIAGDFNSDPMDGDSREGAAGQLLNATWIDSSCTPVSTGAAEAAAAQGGINEEHQGNPAADTSDFNDRYTGNLRLDYVLPSNNLKVKSCGVFWPASGEDGHQLISVSDHRLVWLDVSL